MVRVAVVAAFLFVTAAVPAHAGLDGCVPADLREKAGDLPHHLEFAQSPAEAHPAATLDVVLRRRNATTGQDVSAGS
ncbi:hypothetical protein [Lentzea sp. NPDC055074]